MVRQAHARLAIYIIINQIEFILLQPPLLAMKTNLQHVSMNIERRNKKVRERSKCSLFWILAILYYYTSDLTFII